MSIDWDRIKQRLEEQYRKARQKEEENVRRMKEIGYQALCHGQLPEGVKALNETPPRSKS